MKNFLSLSLRSMLAFSCLVLIGQWAGAATVATTTLSVNPGSLDGLIVSGDLLSGLVGSDDGTGWHGANSNPANPLILLTDDGGTGGVAAPGGAGLWGLSNDGPGSGVPTKTVSYDLGGAFDISKINIFSDWGDGRSFSTTVVSFSTDGGANFSQLGYFQSVPSGSVWANNATLVEIADDQVGGLLGTGVTDITFEFFASGSGPNGHDPYDGVNPHTGVDDLTAAAVASTALSEIDVIGTATIPEPASLLLMGFAAVSALSLRRRKV